MSLSARNPDQVAAKPQAVSFPQVRRTATKRRKHLPAPGSLHGRAFQPGAKPKGALLGMKAPRLTGGRWYEAAGWAGPPYLFLDVGNAERPTLFNALASTSPCSGRK